MEKNNTKETHTNRTVKDYYFKKLLGSGNFGSVYLVENIKDKTKAACKIIKKSKIKQNPKLGQLVNNQIMVLYNCEDINVVKYLSSFQDDDYVYIVMQYCNGGDMDQYLKSKGGKLCEQEAKYFLNEIIKGFKSIRIINAVHRDFKPQNILINNGVVKIADLGFSKILSQQATTYTVLGTLYTMAPEVIAKKPYGPQCDIWSLGVVYYKMLHGKYPYIAVNYPEMLKKISKNKLQFNQNISNDSKDFITRCLIMQPKQRIKWVQIQQHSLFTCFYKPLLLQISDQLTKSKQFYISNYKVLKLSNQIVDSNLIELINSQKSQQFLQTKAIQNKLNYHYYNIYIAIRMYIFSRVKDLELIKKNMSLEKLKNVLKQDQHVRVGYIYSKQTLYQISELLNGLYKKQDSLNLKYMMNQFFQSQEYKILVILLKNDYNIILGHFNYFKSQMNQQNIAKLEVNQSNAQDVKIRKTRYTIQYTIQLFNNINKVDLVIATNILFLIKSLTDELQLKYKNPQVYSHFGTNGDLRIIWNDTRQTLDRLMKMNP